MTELQIGSLRLQPRRQVLSDGLPIHLGRRALDILTILAEANGEVVSKDELMEAVWPGVIVEENAIQAHVAALRKALGEEAERLTTVRGIGYRLEMPEQAVRAVVEPTAQSVAVLPFANLSGDPSKDYLADVIAQEITLAMAQSGELKVPAWRSSLYYKDRNEDLRTIGRQLSVEAIVEGAIKARNGKVRVSAQLVDAASGYHIWSDTFDCEEDDLPAIDNTLAERIAEALRVRLRPQEKATTSSEALACYQKARALTAVASNRVSAEIMGLYREAMQIDGNFAQAHSSFALQVCNRVMMGEADPGELDIARSAAQRALAIKPTLVEGHTAMAFYGILKGKWRLVEDHSGIEDICPVRSTFLAVVGHLESGMIRGDIAIANNPLCCDNIVSSSVIAWLTGDLVKTRERVTQGIATGYSASVMPVPLVRGELALAEGDIEKAIEMYCLVFAAAPEDREVSHVMRLCLDAHMRGEPSELANAALRRFAESDHIRSLIYRMPPIAGLLIRFFTVQGDLDSAFEIADGLVADWRAIGKIDQPSLMLLWLPEMESFRRDPRFTTLAHELGFIDYWRSHGFPGVLTDHPMRKEFA